ncbi:MAG TPA: hypothetical protein VIG51_06435 [Candidatus Baltobacteraceae bacterium]|jgi:hypothetical protein
MPAFTIYVEFIGDLTTGGIEAIRQTLEAEDRDAFPGIAISLKRLKAARWNAVLALAKACRAYRDEGRDVFLMGTRSTRILFAGIEPTLDWVDSIGSSHILRHVIVANRDRADEHAVA